MKDLSAFDGKALRSLRNNDFDPFAAIAEVIDNSIEANSKNIHIRIINHTPLGSKKPRPKIIAFGDDGSGMNMENLQYCLRLGHSTRYNSRKGIGRFGVGMTNGAISVAQLIEVYSRQKQGRWFYTSLDIEDRQDNPNPLLTEVIEKELPDEFKDLVGDMGTLVIWKNIDRIEPDFKVVDLVHRLGRIYRKFIGKKIIEKGKIVDNKNIINITVDDGSTHIVNAFDPLYYIADQFHIQPENETSGDFYELPIEYPVHSVDRPEGGETIGKIIIRTTFTPKSWRKIRRNSGRSAENNKRRIYENEGISILRAGREVAYRPIPHFSPPPLEKDRFWSCEIDFEPVLDHQFSVKNIKLGAKPLNDLNKTLGSLLRPSINKYRDFIDDYWNENEAEENQDQDSINSHSKAEKIFSETTTKNTTKLQPEKEKEIIIQHGKEKNYTDEEINILLDKITNGKLPIQIIEDKTGRPDGLFIDIVPKISLKLITYNLKHAFFMSVYGKLQKIKEMSNDETGDKELLTLANDLKTDIDLLIGTYVDSRHDVINTANNDDNNDVIQNLFEDLDIKWSDSLRRAYREKFIDYNVK